MGSPTAAVPLLPYQRRWVSDRSRLKAGMWARQTGKTFSTTLEIVLDCLEAAAEGRRTRWVILSRGERQAREAMEEGVKRHCAAVQLAYDTLEQEYAFEASYKALEVVLPGGSRITALPANPDTARGFSANVFLDEFAFHQDDRAIWRAMFPIITRGWKLRVVSTPNGMGNKFYEIMTGQDDQWSRHVVDIYQAVADGLPVDIEALRAAMNDPEGWAQEFELRWVDEGTAWLSWEAINAAEHPEAGRPELYRDGPCYVGVDIATRRDLFVIWVLERTDDGVLWTREIFEARRISFEEQQRELDRVMRTYNVAACYMDQTGMGEMPVEWTRRRWGDRVQGVWFTQQAKLDLAQAGRRAFEDRLIRIPQGNLALRADLRSLRRAATATGGVRFEVTGGTDSHADRTWACFLACYAAAQHQGGPVEWQGTGLVRVSWTMADYMGAVS
jgi:phage FluMu gp28-like protein